MSCPLCGEVCRCVPGNRTAQTRPSMRPRFEPELESEAGISPAEVMIDPEAPDSSEQQFAASLERKDADQRARFVVEREDRSADKGPPEAEHTSGETLGPTMGCRRYEGGAEAEEQSEPEAGPVQADLLPTQDESWRQEVAARVNHYRARRRPRSPRYPSLRLKFEPSEPGWTSPGTSGTLLPTRATRQAVAVESAQPQPAPAPGAPAEPMPNAAPETAKVIEFPRAATAPPRPLDELAEPVLDRPRILEVPEVVPPPPALGGILIEPAEQADQEKRPGFEIPLQSAPMSRRMLAGAVDAVLVLTALAGFGYIFLRMTTVALPVQQGAAAAGLLAGVLWAAYHYLMLVYAGTTPGLIAAKLRLSRFDGSAATRSLRRWRVLASVLSGVSLGLGYAWCFLDEDGLCWHDRITRTYLAPRSRQ